MCVCVLFLCRSPKACPDSLRFSQNLIGQWANTSAVIFEGNFNDTSSLAAGQLRFEFERNFYWSELQDVDLAKDAVFGGESTR